MQRCTHVGDKTMLLAITQGLVIIGGYDKSKGIYRKNAVGFASISGRSCKKALPDLC